MRRKRYDETDEGYLREMEVEGIIAWALLFPLVVGLILFLEWYFR